MTKTVTEKHSNYFVWLDYYKIIFTIGVCLMHFESTYYPSNSKIFEGMYLAVDFFFILSGYFIYQTYENSKDKSVRFYIMKRWKEFFPPMVIMLLLFLMYEACHIIKVSSGLIEAVSNIGTITFGAIFEGLFLQMFVPVSMYNFPLWYISVLLVVGTIIYYVLNKKNGNIRKYVVPIIIVCIYIYAYMYQRYGNIDIHTNVNPVLGLYDGVFRGLADISTGIVLYYFLSRYTKQISKHAIWCIRIICWICIGWCMFFDAHSKNDYVCILAIILLIGMEVQHGSIRVSSDQKKRLLFMRKYAMYIYFSHYFVCKKIWGLLHRYINYNYKWADMFFYCVAIIISGILLMIATKKLKYLMNIKLNERRNMYT